jgi:hypothetical protein
MQKVSEVYKNLYHYTTWEGLQGILETQTLWATHYKFLNDYSEIILFKDKLSSWIHPYVLEGYKNLIKHKPGVKKKINHTGGLRKVVQHDAKGLIESQYSALGDEIYILSFCGEPADLNIANNGLLSQWRGYGAGGGAVLVFDTKKLEALLDIESSMFEYCPILLADIVYSDDEEKLKEELSDDLKILAGVAKQFFNHNNIEQEFIDSSKAYFPFVRCISRYKHYGFKEENEVRVVALPTVIGDEIKKLAARDGKTLRPEKEIKSRLKNGNRIPYIELFRSIDAGLPIKKIIIGPHPEKESRAKELRKKIAKKNIEVTCSDIPYVG